MTNSFKLCFNFSFFFSYYCFFSSSMALFFLIFSIYSSFFCLKFLTVFGISDCSLPLGIRGYVVGMHFYADFVRTIYCGLFFSMIVLSLPYTFANPSSSLILDIFCYCFFFFFSSIYFSFLLASWRFCKNSIYLFW